MNNNDLDKTRDADNQKRVRLANLMAEAYRKQLERLSKDDPKANHEPLTASHTNEKKTSITFEENSLLRGIISSLEISLKKQDKLITELDEKYDTKYTFEKNIKDIARAINNPSRNALVFAEAFSLTVLLLLVRAICISIFSSPL
jgi:hypothetical protein